MAKTNTYDIAVIGAGSAGLTAARLAAEFGVSVVLFEKKDIGGDCLNTGCVPSKSIISLAQKIYESQKLDAYGLKTSYKINYPEIKKFIASSVEHIRDHSDSIEPLEKAGIHVVQESVTFTTGKSVITDSGDLYTFRKCIIATGSSPNMVTVDGLSPEDVVTSDTIWGMSTFPRQLVVMGGGVIGAELAQAYAMLGSQVTIVEKGSRLMARHDDFVGDAVTEGLIQSGVDILYESDVISVKSETKLKVRIKTGKKSQTYTADKILTSIGRHSNVNGLGLDVIDIKYSKKDGISVNKKFQTNVKNIYAAGDCNGSSFFTHVAGEEAASAVVHALFGRQRPVNWDALSWGLFTRPEVAHLGKTQKELTAAGTKFTIEKIDYNEIDKAVASHENGNIHLYLDKKRRILGATIIGDKASELIGYYTYIMAHKQKLDMLALPMQAYPTHAMALRKHASDIQRTAFIKSKIPWVILKLRGY
jgi:pyruvate/2-oxoglutarate dehydrogenase complex dihydrolipoamide dehydrogenase (E3) component